MIIIIHIWIFGWKTETILYASSMGFLHEVLRKFVRRIPYSYWRVFIHSFELLADKRKTIEQINKNKWMHPFSIYLFLSTLLRHYFHLISCFFSFLAKSFCHVPRVNDASDIRYERKKGEKVIKFICVRQSRPII